MKNIVVGMSGGVDSSVTALLLKQQGYSVSGLFMKNWEEDDTDEYCSAAEDLDDAKGVCERLGIKLHTINFAAEYWDNVFTYFIAEYKAGRTPNPDILCNKEIKFKLALNYALDNLGSDFFATGHYAKKSEKDGCYFLQIPKDKNKDQTYFLYTLGQKQLSKILFPLQDLTKPEIRGIAIEHGLVNAKKRDSTGICFIGKRNFKDFLSKYLPAMPGDIITEGNEVIGCHDGLMYYTLGQRQGLGIGGVKNCDGAWYVAKKDLDTNKLVVVQQDDHLLLLSKYLTAVDLHWVNLVGTDLVCTVKTRYRQKTVACKVNIADGVARVDFDKPQKAVTPGQSVVFYSDEICLGGGVISSRG